MSRTDKDVPEQVRIGRGDVAPGHLEHVHIPGRGDFTFLRRRFYTNVTGEDIRQGFRIRERMAVKESLHRVLREANAVDDVDTLDDSGVEVRAQRRNSIWGGGWFD